LRTRGETPTAIPIIRQEKKHHRGTRTASTAQMVVAVSRCDDRRPRSNVLSCRTYQSVVRPFGARTEMDELVDQDQVSSINPLPTATPAGAKISTKADSAFNVIPTYRTSLSDSGRPDGKKEWNPPKDDGLRTKENHSHPKSSHSRPACPRVPFFRLATPNRNFNIGIRGTILCTEETRADGNILRRKAPRLIIGDRN